MNSYRTEIVVSIEVSYAHNMRARIGKRFRDRRIVGGAEVYTRRTLNMVDNVVCASCVGTGFIEIISVVHRQGYFNDHFTHYTPLVPMFMKAAKSTTCSTSNRIFFVLLLLYIHIAANRVKMCGCNEF